MGTSNSNKGNRGNTPLIPSWLGSSGAVPDLLPASPNGEENNQNLPNPQNTLTPPVFPQIPPKGDADRYKNPRTNFSRYARSGGKDQASLGRAISGYITQTSGGAKNAARSMGSSRVASARVISFLSDVVNRGATEALRSLNLESLAGRPIEDIFIGLADYICPEGGSIDVGIARDAFIQTISDITESGIVDLNTLNVDQVQTFFELYAAHTIETRLYNEIGLKAISFPSDATTAEKIQNQLFDFVKNGVSDALTSSRAVIEKLSPSEILKFVDTIYEQAFTILLTFGNAKSE